MQMFPLIVLVVVGCAGDKSPRVPDDSLPTESGPSDSNPTDSGITDSGATDSGSTDSGSTDSGSTPVDEACDTLDADDPPVTVIVVDADGAERPAERVRWVDASAFDLWENAAEAVCVDGQPPCSRWALPEGLPAWVLIAAEARNEAADPVDRPTCIGWGAMSTMLWIEADTPQRVSLTVPLDALWCDDGWIPMTENIGHFEALNPEEDCLATPPPVTGALTVLPVELDGTPASAAWVSWYHSPKSPEYDGDHPLSCAEAGCGRWVGADAPTEGRHYVEIMSYGPPVPDYLSGAAWIGYGATQVTASVSQEVEVLVDWTMQVR